MKQLKTIGLVALAATALTAFLGANSAPATTLEVTTVTKNESVTITASLESGTSSQLNNTSGSTQNTCTGSHLHGSTAPPYTVTSGKVVAPLTEGENGLSFTGCTRPITIHFPGSLSVERINGTTNGTVRSENAELTVGAPLVGYLTCTTSSEGEDIGTLTGVGHGQATIHINAVIGCGITATWTATYVITSPDGLGVSA
jgi:hypothetical protein